MDKTVENSVKRLKQLLSKLKENSNDLIKKIHPIMKTISNRDEQLIVLALSEKKFSISEEKIIQLLENQVLELIDIPIKIREEIDLFSSLIITDKKQLSVKTPFLYQVWMGDYYGVEKLEGLEKLNKELESIQENLSMEWIISKI